MKAAIMAATTNTFMSIEGRRHDSVMLAQSGLLSPTAGTFF